MPTTRLSTRRIRDLLRLKYAQKVSEREISAALGISKGAVSGYLSRARAAGLSWPLPPELGADGALELHVLSRSAVIEPRATGEGMRIRLGDEERFRLRPRGDLCACLGRRHIDVGRPPSARRRRASAPNHTHGPSRTF